MSSDEAIAKFAADPDVHLPDQLTVQLGRYTAAVGNGEYRFRDRLAWGVSWHECAEPSHELPPGTHIPCTFWLFLDANTGEMLEGEWQLDS